MAASGNRAPGISLTVFGMVFLTVGSVVLYFPIRACRESRAMLRWPTTDAVILETGMRQHQGEDSTTYKVTARYTYEVDGRTYTGTRVGVHTGSDNIGRWHRRTYDLLRQHAKEGTPLPCRVDPEDPSRSVLFPDLRPGLMALMTLLPSLFCVVGAGLAAGGIGLWRRSSQRLALAARHPGQPWQWRPDWAAQRVVEHATAAPWVLAAVAVFWNAVAWGLVAPLLRTGWQQSRLVWLLALVPFGGAWLALAALLRLLRRLRYGRGVLRLASVPVRRGTVLSGELRLGGVLGRHEAAEVRLACVQRLTQQRGQEASTTEDVLWQTRATVPTDAGGSLRVAIPVPSDQPETDECNPDLGVTWRLHVEIRRPGVDYRGRFDVPVFGQAAAPAAAGSADPATGPQGADGDLDAIMQTVQECRLRLQRHPQGGIRLISPPLRSVGLAVAIGVFLAIWVGFTVLLFRLPGVPRVLPVAWVAIDLLAAAMLMDALLWGATVEIRAGRCRAETGVFRRRLDLPSSEVSDVSCGVTAQSGQRVYYSLRLSTPGGRITVAKMIPGKFQAETLAGFLRDALAGRYG